MWSRGKLKQNKMSKKMHIISFLTAAVLLIIVFSIATTYALLYGDLDGSGQRITAGVIRITTFSITDETGFRYRPGDDLIYKGLEFEIEYYFSRASEIRIRLYFRTELCEYDDDDEPIFTRATSTENDDTAKIHFTPAAGFSYNREDNSGNPTSDSGSLYYDSTVYAGILKPRLRGTIENIFLHIWLRGEEGGFVLESGNLTLRLVIDIKQVGPDWDYFDDYDWENAAQAYLGS